MDVREQLVRLYGLDDSESKAEQEQTQIREQPQRQPLPPPLPKVLDTRPRAAFLRRRLAGAVSVEALALRSSCFLLPDQSVPFAVVLPAPGEHTVVQDAAAHGRRLPDGSVALHLKGAASVQEFLTACGRTWSVSTWLEDGEQLWAAAEELGLAEGPAAEPRRLARRCLFAPSPLLEAAMDALEASLAEQRAAEQQRGGRLLLRALDVGCGSGRDVAWLASRDRAVPLVQPPQQQQQQQWEQQRELQELQEQHHGQRDQRQDREQPQALQPGQPAEGQQHGGQLRVCWHVTGVDSWLGALERAHQLAQAMELSEEQVELVFCSVCSDSGAMKLQPLPAKARGKLGSAAWFTCAPPASGAGERRAPVGQPPADAELPAAAEQPPPPPPLVAAQPLPAFAQRQYDLVVCVRFLERAALPTLARLVRPGGFVLYSTFVDGPGLRAFGRPSGEEHILQPGELAGQHFGLRQGFDVLRDDVALTDDGREISWFVARKRPAPRGGGGGGRAAAAPGAS